MNDGEGNRRRKKKKPAEKKQGKEKVKWEP